MKPLLTVLLCTVSFLGCRTNETPEAQVNDFEITANVKSKLASDVGLATVPNISVNTTNGVVTLSGMVSTADQKAKATTAAGSVPHVVKVVNNLQIAQTPTNSRLGSSSDTVAAASRTPRRWNSPYADAATTGTTPSTMKMLSGAMRSQSSVLTIGC
jgi:hypothetical protein